MLNTLQHGLVKQLEEHHASVRSVSLNQLFSEDKARFQKYALHAAGLFVDYSKNHINSTTCQMLVDLARESCLESAIDDLFSGKPVNRSEKRAALHTALRLPGSESLWVNQQDVTARVREQRARMQIMVEDLHAGVWRGFSGKPITDVVNIGIGGSDLGPAMTCQALGLSAQTSIRLHFVSNVDIIHFKNQLKQLNPETTLFVVVSKTFTTFETLTNAKLAKDWLLHSACDVEHIASHLIAVTNNVEQARQFGVPAKNILSMSETVGGRYSIWSTVGFTLALLIGMDGFKQFLAGAHAMDVHFKSTEFLQNMPVMLALIDIWYGNFCGYNNRAVIPYSNYLEKFPTYLQQLCMESQGKRVTKQGEPLRYPTGLIIWGGVGSNTQHSFHQLLMQGMQKTAIDFIIPKTHVDGCKNKALMAHCLAQSQVLMQGFLNRPNTHSDDVLAAHKQITGNVPSNTLIMQCLDPYALGSLIALYEHKVFVQSAIWNINPFDQWGVERGKQLASTIHLDLLDKKASTHYDSSTNGLIKTLLEE